MHAATDDGFVQPSRARMVRLSRNQALAAVAAAAGGSERRLAGADTRHGVVRLWREWRTATIRAEAMARHCARLERALTARIGAPVLSVELAPGNRVDLADRRSLAGLCTGRPDLDHRHLAGLLDRRLDQWRGEAEACGLAAAETLVEALDRWAEALVRQATATPARSRRAMAAKLSLALELADPGARDDGAWQLVRSTLRDLGAPGRRRVGEGRSKGRAR